MSTPLVTDHQSDVSPFTIVSFYCPSHFWAASAPRILTSSQFVKFWHAIPLFITVHCLSLVLSLFPFQCSLKLSMSPGSSCGKVLSLLWEMCSLSCRCVHEGYFVFKPLQDKRLIHASCSHFNTCSLILCWQQPKKKKSRYQIQLQKVWGKAK